MSLKAIERETSVNFLDGEDIGYIYTCNRPLMTKLDKLCKSCPNEYKLEKEDDVSKTYVFDKSLISFRKPTKRKPLTEEQRALAAERLKKARNINNE